MFAQCSSNLADLCKRSFSVTDLEEMGLNIWNRLTAVSQDSSGTDTKSGVQASGSGQALQGLGLTARRLSPLFKQRVS